MFNQKKTSMYSPRVIRGRLHHRLRALDLKIKVNDDNNGELIFNLFDKNSNKALGFASFITSRKVMARDYYIVDNERKHAVYLSYIEVDRSLKGLNVGNMLMCYALDKLVFRGYTDIYLHAAEDTKRSGRLVVYYKRMGFELIDAEDFLMHINLNTLSQQCQNGIADTLVDVRYVDGYLDDDVDTYQDDDFDQQEKDEFDDWDETEAENNDYLDWGGSEKDELDDWDTSAENNDDLEWGD